MQSTTRIICGAVGLVFIIGCATTSYDEDPLAHMDFKSRSVVEKMSDDDISVNGADSMAAMKKERKLQIAVAVDISEQSQGRAKPPSPEKLGCGLVVSFTGTRCAVAVRATRRPGMLLAQPLFFTEVNFQGDMTK